MPIDYTHQLEKVGKLTSFHHIFDVKAFEKACDALGREIEKSDIGKVITLLLAPMGKTVVQQYTTGIPSLPGHDYDAIRYQVKKWFDEVLPNDYLHFFWMGRLTAPFLGLDYSLTDIVRNEVLGLEPAWSLRRILGKKKFEGFIKPLREQIAGLYRELGYDRQPWTNVPPGAEVRWRDKVIMVWDLYEVAFDGLANAVLPKHIIEHPKVFEATYYEQVPSVSFGDYGEA
jgi:hypothetical protein